MFSHPGLIGLCVHVASLSISKNKALPEFRAVLTAPHHPDWIISSLAHYQHFLKILVKSVQSRCTGRLSHPSLAEVNISKVLYKSLSENLNFTSLPWEGCYLQTSCRADVWWKPRSDSPHSSSAWLKGEYSCAVCPNKSCSFVNNKQQMLHKSSIWQSSLTRLGKNRRRTNTSKHTVISKVTVTITMLSEQRCLNTCEVKCQVVVLRKQE